MSLKILCRADGNSIIGLGHMYRIFSIIEFYKDTFEVIFLTRETSTLKSIPQDYTTKLIPEHIVLEQEAIVPRSPFKKPKAKKVRKLKLVAE